MPFPSPGDLPDLGIEPRSPSLEVDSLSAEPPGSTEASLKCFKLKLTVNLDMIHICFYMDINKTKVSWYVKNTDIFYSISFFRNMGHNLVFPFHKLTNVL